MTSQNHAWNYSCFQNDKENKIYRKIVTNKKSRKEMSLVKIMRWTAKVTALTGASQLVARPSAATKFYVSKVLIIYTSFLILLLVTVAICRIKYREKDLINNLVANVITPMFITTYMSVVVADMVNSLYHANSFCKLLNDLIYCAERVSKLVKDVKIKKRKIFLTIGYILTTLALFADIVPWNQWLSMFSQYISILLISSAQAHFMIHATVMSELIEMLNKGLAKNLENARQRYKTIKDEPALTALFLKKVKYDVQQFRIVYFDVYSISQKLVELFSFRILLLIALYTAFALVSSYFTQSSFQYFIITLKSIQLELGLDWSRSACLTFLLIWFMISSCSEAVFQANRLQSTLQKYSVIFPSEFICMELQRFSIQLKVCTVKFSPINLITLDNGLIMSIINTTITYLIILSQMDRKLSEVMELELNNTKAGQVQCASDESSGD